MLDEHGDGPADGARAGDGHRRVREQRTRSRAQRAAADHRMAAARHCPRPTTPSPDMAADRHVRHRGCRGDEIGRRVEVATRRCTTMSWPQHGDHRRQRRTGSARSSRRRRVRRRGRPDRRPQTATRTSSAPVRGGEYVRHLVRIARELPEIAGELAAPVRRDPGCADRCCPATRSTWSRPGCAA